MGAIAYGPIIIMMFIVFVIEVRMKTKLKATDWVCVLLFFNYTIISTLYYVLKPFNGKFLTTHFLVILVLPFLILSIIRLYYYSKDFNAVKFKYNLIILFLIAEVFICLGQFATYTFGIGLPISEEYGAFFAITGTFTNPNDLACVVLLIAYLFIGIEANFTLWKKRLIWGSALLLLLLTGSRSALILGFLFFIFSRGYNLKNIIYVGMVCLLLAFSYNYFSTASDGVLGRVISRVDSIYLVLTGGLSKDGSMSIRLDSYFHFFENFDSLRIGSGEIGNYFMFAKGAEFNPALMFQNPHSIIVELGYWIGWFGLFLFSIAFIYLSKFSNRKISVLILSMVSTVISSSVLGNLIFFLFFTLTFFDTKKQSISIHNSKSKLGK